MTFPKMISEADFLGQVIDLAHLCGWRVQHVRPAWSNKGWRTPIQGDPGFPDLVLVKQPRVIIAELKSDKGSVDHEQRAWLTELAGCPGVESYVWKPRIWDDIVAILKAPLTSVRG